MLHRVVALAVVTLLLCAVVYLAARDSQGLLHNLSFAEKHQHGEEVRRQSWPALFDNVANVPTPAAYVHAAPAGVPVSVVMTVFDQEGSIAQVVGAILDTATGPFELVAVFDRCTDASAARVQERISRYLETHSFRQNARDAVGCVGYRAVVLAETHYETRANNAGLRAAQFGHAILVQDDMLLVQPGWDRHMLRPALGYSDVLAVTAKCAHNDRWRDAASIEWADMAGNCGHHDFDAAWTDTFVVRDVATRGPLLLDMHKLRKLDYLADEYYPQEMDDHDNEIQLCLRAYQQFGWVCGLFAVSVHSDYSWSHRRKDANARPAILQTAESKNLALTARRHGAYLRESQRHNQDRKVRLTD